MAVAISSVINYTSLVMFRQLWFIKKRKIYSWKLTKTLNYYCYIFYFKILIKLSDKNKKNNIVVIFEFFFNNWKQNYTLHFVIIVTKTSLNLIF